ncbi:centrosomal protein kizuna isoform X2 [Carlito syrichta]|uniref:Centrosomal protein kizuna n=1 Tax=Carlito syrichta TaxID=1868482 RepID=A0A1U7UA07_CARSF|nr:centrosomal protein kizuna isoform X2 [Carlito syrichta]
MRRTAASSAPESSSDFYDRLRQLQEGLRDSEKKRLDLEEKLYEYNRSDICRVKLKYGKLKKYLKEICESEKAAHARNREYLKQLERVQAHVRHFTTNTEKLQRLKIEYETQIKRMQLFPKDNLGLKGALKDEDREKVAVQAGINSETAISRGLYQPATIFMGRQMSAVSSIGDFHTEQKSPQPTKNFSISDPHSHRQTAQSSNVTDSGVVQTSSDTQCLNKSDKIDGKASLQIGEKTPVTASVLSEEEQTHCLEIGSNTRHSKSNLSEGKNSAKLPFPLQERLSPENRTTDLKCDSCSRSEGSEGEILTREHIEVEEERADPPVSLISVSEYCASGNKWSQEKHSAWEGFSDQLAHGNPKSQKPFTNMQEEEEESSSSSSDLTVSVSDDDLILESPELQPNPSNKMEREGGMEALTLIHAEQERDTPSAGKSNCALQTLSPPDAKEESSASSSAGESEPAPDTDLLREKSGHRAATSREPNNLLKEEVTSLLKTTLAEKPEDVSAVHGAESSLSLPPILHEESGIKKAMLGPRLDRVPPGEQETKAYQLLKKSTLQDNTDQTEDRFHKIEASVSLLSGLNLGSSTFKTKTTNRIASGGSSSSSEGSPLSRHENKKKLTTNVKPKVFWDESDDSNSEIEAALRPRSHNTSTSDFDDFYD